MLNFTNKDIFFESATYMSFDDRRGFATTISQKMLHSNIGEGELNKIFKVARFFNIFEKH